MAAKFYLCFLIAIMINSLPPRPIGITGIVCFFPIRGLLRTTRGRGIWRGLRLCDATQDLAAKALQSLVIVGKSLGQELERDVAIKARVLRLVDHTHPSAAELFDDAVMGNSLADHSVCESYVGDSGKSKKAEGLLAPHSDHCRKIALPLTIWGRSKAYRPLCALLGTSGSGSAAAGGRAIFLELASSLKISLRPQSNACAAEVYAFRFGQMLGIQPAEQGLVTDADGLGHLLRRVVLFHAFEFTCLTAASKGVGADSCREIALSQVIPVRDDCIAMKYRCSSEFVSRIFSLSLLSPRLLERVKDRSRFGSLTINAL
jgi:hypothetical protein